MITWRPIAELPDELKDGREVHLRSDHDFDRVGSWGKFHMRWDGPFSPPEFGWMDCDGEHIASPTHFAEINAPEGQG